MPLLLSRSGVLIVKNIIMNANNLINWGELSRQLTGERTYIRRNRIPKKYKEKVEMLLKILEDWHNMI